MHVEKIYNVIYEIRGEKVMFDFDLAKMYEVETRVLNQAIKRNADKFPKDFMLRLTEKEWKAISSSQFVMMVNLPKNRTRSYLPYAFTEHGVTMLASVLRSNKAVKMNIAIVRAFIAMRKFALTYKDIVVEITELKKAVGNHDKKLNQLFQAELLLQAKQNEKDWSEREKIGFKKIAYAYK